MSFGKITRMVAGVLSLATLTAFAACGTTDSGQQAASGNGTTSASTPGPLDVSGIAKDDAIAALLPDSITEKGKLTVGMDTSYAPAEFLAEDGKTPIGYDVDLVHALSAVFGLKADPVTATFDSIIPSIGSKYDVGISSFTITKERSEAVDFVSYFKAGMTYAVKKGNPAGLDPDNLCGVKMAVQTATTEEEEANAASKKCEAAGKKKIDVQSYKLQTDVTTALVTGKVDVFYADTPVTGYAISQTGGQLQTLGEDVGVLPQGIAVKKGDSRTAKAMQQAVQKLMDDGTYMKILTRWGAQSGAIDKAEINPTVEG